MEPLWIWLILAFFVIALLYSMVGFGGGSSYLAVLALAGLPYQHIPPIALICNLIVAGTGFYYFLKGGHFNLRKALPFVVLSIPMAYWGGRIPIGKELFAILLGLSLLAAALRMLMPGDRFDGGREVSPKKAWAIGLPSGAALGFLSGLVGIGGGIFLSPLLLFLRWVNVKQAGASASFFIIVNSLSGLLGQLHKGPIKGEWECLWFLGAVVFIGGQIGSRFGSFHVPKIVLQRVLALLITAVAVKMMMGAS